MGKKYKGHNNVANHAQHNTAHKCEKTNNLHDPQRHHFFKPMPEKNEAITDDPCTKLALVVTALQAASPRR